jgi:hypothetical protein
MQINLISEANEKRRKFFPSQRFPIYRWLFVR